MQAKHVRTLAALGLTATEDSVRGAQARGLLRDLRDVAGMALAVDDPLSGAERRLATTMARAEHWLSEGVANG